MKNGLRELPAAQFISSFIRKIGRDSVAAYAAQSALFLIISFFPFVMLLFALTEYIPIDAEELSAFARDYIPESVSELIGGVLTEMRGKTSRAVVPLTVVTALWSASRGFYSIINGLNAVYGARETRNSVGVRLGAVIYTLLFMAALIITLFLWTFGSVALEAASVIINSAVLISVLRSVFGFTLLAAIFWLIYIFVPNRKTKALRELPGALVCAAGWIGFSFLFSFYFDNFSDYYYIYGSLTAVVLLMLWVYFCMYIMLAGAEINWFIARLSC